MGGELIASCNARGQKTCKNDPVLIGRLGAVVKFDTGTSYKYDLVTFDFKYSLSGSGSYLYKWSLGNFDHHIIYENVYAPPNDDPDCEPWCLPFPPFPGGD